MALLARLMMVGSVLDEPEGSSSAGQNHALGGTVLRRQLADPRRPVAERGPRARGAGRGGAGAQQVVAGSPPPKNGPPQVV